MIISLKRARQRARTLAAERGVTHQKALDLVAADAGFGTWSAMAKACSGVHRVARLPDVPPPLGVLAALDPLDPSTLSRSPEVVAVAISFMVGMLDHPAGDGAERLLCEVLVRDRVMMVLEGHSPLEQAGDTFAIGLAHVVSRWLRAEERRSDEAAKMGGYYDASWERAARDEIAGAARMLEMPDAKAAALRVMRPDVVGARLQRALRVLEEFDADPVRAMAAHPLEDLPDDLVGAILRAGSPVASLSEWQASVLENALSLGEGVAAGRDDPLAAAHAHMMRHAMPMDVRVRLVRTVFDVVPGEAGSPFPHVSTLPGGTSPTARWVRDLIVKAREGRRGFSFNPLASALASNCRETLMEALVPVMDTAPRGHGEEVERKARELIVDTAFLCHVAGASAAEIAGGPVSEVTLAVVRDVLSRNERSIGQLSLFAALHGRVGQVSFDEAEADSVVTSLALATLAPF